MRGMAKETTPDNAYRDSVLSLVYAYSSKVDTAGLHAENTYAYTKMQMHTIKRNATLMLVPSMFAIAHGTGRKFISEYYSKVSHSAYEGLQNHRLLKLSTIPYRSNSLSAMLTYMTPNIYDVNLFQNNILSPFHRKNHRFYTYHVTSLPFDKAQILIYPKIKNTQTIEAKAIVDSKTGQVILVDMDGEYDMTHFFISILMGKSGHKSLLPLNCSMKFNFKFMGNNITGMLTTYYSLPKVLPDTLDNVADTALMSMVRPIPLTQREQDIYTLYYEKKHQKDSIRTANDTTKKSNFAKDVLWDVIGDNVLNRFYQDFGKENKGSVRISPILNPLYMGYTKSKGFIYKFDIRSSYSFNEDLQLAIRFRAGYSFKLKQLYFSIPATFNYNKKHDAYLELEYGQGNRINSNVIARSILGVSEKYDESFKILREDFTEFSDSYFKLKNQWMFNKHLGMDIGLTAHYRKAIYPRFYEIYNQPYSYKSVAPSIGLIWFPLGKEKDLMFTADYEQSIRGFLKSNIPYGRIEIDGKHILYASRRQSYSMRLGTGFYTMRGSHWYFIDYTNFCDNYIPNGWNDDWSGNFELLNSVWYNTSEYYVRGNFTYETPMLMASWLPLVGRYIEAERLYVNALSVKHLTPYTEWGYGCTTRLMSLGAFMAFKQAKFYGIGCKFSFQLFQNW